MLEIRPNNKNWHTRGDDTKARLDAAACLAKGKIDITAAEIGRLK